MNKILKLILALAIVTTLFSSSLFAKEAVDFTLYDLAGAEVSLSDFSGRPMILFFWTTWCPYCRREIAELNGLYPELQDSGIELLSINIEESKSKVERFLKTYPMDFKVLLDREAGVAYSYNLIGVPTYVLIDQEGEVKFTNNYFPQKKYRKILLRQDN